MTDVQLLEFALAGGLRCDCTATQARLDASLDRLKQLLLVGGAVCIVTADYTEGCLLGRLRKVGNAALHVCCSCTIHLHLPVVPPPSTPQVFGDWPSVATALQHQPELLGAAPEAVEGLLQPPQQQMWRLVAQQMVQQQVPQ